MANSLCMFMDERWETIPMGVRLIVGCIVVDEATWKADHYRATGIPQLRESRRLSAISRLLTTSGGFGRVAFADMPSGLLEAGRRDGSDDILSMSRRDNAWSILVALLAMAILRRLHDNGINSASIDLYHDPKNLTPSHWLALKSLIRETLPDIAREVSGVCCAYRNICQVMKPKPGACVNEHQMGTLIAHHLCAQTEKLIANWSLPRIEYRNESEILVASIMLFE